MHCFCSRFGRCDQFAEPRLPAREAAPHEASVAPVAPANCRTSCETRCTEVLPQLLPCFCRQRSQPHPPFLQGDQGQARFRRDHDVTTFMSWDVSAFNSAARAASFDAEMSTPQHALSSDERTTSSLTNVLCWSSPVNHVQLLILSFHATTAWRSQQCCVIELRRRRADVGTAQVATWAEVVAGAAV